MTKIKITTTQNIDIEYELATVFERMLAWLLDFIVILCIAMVFWIVLSPVISSEEMALATAGSLALLYHLFAEALFNGQSIGKMAMRIRVVRIDGSPPGIVNYMLRWLFRAVDCNPLVFNGAPAVVAVAFTDRGQRLGDLAAGTTVIKTESRPSFGETIFSKSGQDYQPVFPKADRLSDQDANTIKDVLLLYRRTRNLKQLNACANRVCHVLEVVPPKNMNAEQFLKVILRDYSHMS